MQLINLVVLPNKKVKAKRIKENLTLMVVNQLFRGRQRTGDVPWRSPEVPKVLDLQRTFRDQCKTWWFNDSIVFRRNKYFKVLNSNVHGTQLWDVQGSKWWDVIGTSVGYRPNKFFKFNSQTYWTFFEN